MGKIKRGGYIFVAWIGDHSTKHVHVFKDNRLVLIWNLEAGVARYGWVSKKLKKLIDQLLAEGYL